MTVEAGATLFFDWDVCCEKIYDNLYFLVDGKEVYELNSEMTARFNGWKTVRYTFRNAGTYTVTWSYVKDEGTFLWRRCMCSGQRDPGWTLCPSTRLPLPPVRTAA